MTTVKERLATIDRKLYDRNARSFREIEEYAKRLARRCDHAPREDVALLTFKRPALLGRGVVAVAEHGWIIGSEQGETLYLTINRHIVSAPNGVKGEAVFKYSLLDYILTLPWDVDPRDIIRTLTKYISRTKN